MKDQTFGIEIEMNHISRQKAARVIAATLPSSALGDSATVRHTGGRTYDVWEVTGVDGRVWKVMRDGSIGSGPSAAGPLEEQCEVVSPVCRWEDIPLVQDIVRALKDAGAVAHSSCGIHIHIGRGSHTPQTLRNLVKLQRSFQPHRQLAGRPAHTGAPNQPGAPRLLVSAGRRDLPAPPERPASPHTGRAGQAVVPLLWQVRRAPGRGAGLGDLQRPALRPQPLPSPEPAQHLLQGHHRVPGLAGNFVADATAHSTPGRSRATSSCAWPSTTWL